MGWFKVKTKGFIKPLALGQREKVKTKGFIKPLALGGIGFEFARGMWEKVRGECGFSSLMKQNKKAKICFVICFAGKKNYYFIFML